MQGVHDLGMLGFFAANARESLLVNGRLRQKNGADCQDGQHFSHWNSIPYIDRHTAFTLVWVV